MKKVLADIALIILCGVLLGGCAKEDAPGLYNAVIRAVGDLPLTESASLRGVRAFGEDHYTGTYSADYVHCSRREILFGGICIDRAAGDEITVSCELTVKDGAAQLFWKSGNDEPAVLLEAGGTYADTLTLPKAGNYIGIECFDFTGSLELTIE